MQKHCITKQVKMLCSEKQTAISASLLGHLPTAAEHIFANVLLLFYSVISWLAAKEMNPLINSLAWRRKIG